MEFDYTVKTNKTFNDVVAAVEKETTKVGFKVLHIQDIKKTLGSKGFKVEPMKIIEVCNAKFAYSALQADIKIGLCLPCKINVYVENGKTYLCGMRPIILPKLFPKANLKKLPKEVDVILKTIIDNAA